jgi:hypothetical protein
VLLAGVGNSIMGWFNECGPDEFADGGLGSRSATEVGADRQAAPTSARQSCSNLFNFRVRLNQPPNQ